MLTRSLAHHPPAPERRRRDRARAARRRHARSLDEKVTVVGPRAAGPQGRDARDQGRRAGARATTRSSASRAATSRPASTCTCNNLAMGAFDRDYAFGADAKPTQYVVAAGDVHGHRPRRRPRRDAQLHRHPVDGELLGDRRARHRRPLHARARSRRFPNVDGVVALTHGSGCGMDTHGEGMKLLRRTLGGYARHANFAGVLMSAWAARRTRSARCSAREKLQEGPLLRTFSIQDTGGTAKTIAHGIAHDRGDAAARQRGHARSRCRRRTSSSACSAAARTAIPASPPIPALGAAVDLLVRHGGTAILSETPEIYGAEHLLTRRAVSRDGRREAHRAHQVVGGLHRRARRAR